MNAIKTTVKNGRIEIATPTDWPEGMEVLVKPVATTEGSGATEPQALREMAEEEQREDPESVARWLAELDAIPPLSMSAEEEADLEAWKQKVKAFNVEAVRRQMEEGIS